MKKQDYSNHRRYYIPHHFILLPFLAILIIIGVKNIVTDPIHSLEWKLFSISIFSILYVAIMLRQHYALGNQNRIVRLEFRLRYFELFNKSTGTVEQQLSFSQIAALRFTNDEEFIDLLNKTLKENLTGNEIKKAIKNWQPDDARV
jgi:hypothetical protein